MVPLARGTEPASFAEPRVTRAAVELPPVRARSTVTREPSTAMTPAEVQQLTIGVDVSGAQGQELSLELSLPDGTMYQRLSQTLGPDPWHPQHVDFVVPVTGTWIDSFDLTGTWDSHVYLGPAELLHDTFELKP
ncbi:MAG: hypothetical protein IPJ65_29840 [Archangiaceae bacterium]|nr:hypothetical protein [Archangiaceae bacterium]